MRIGGITGRRPGHIDFLPLRIGLIPENCPPGFVQSVQRTVFFLKEHTESRRIAFGIKLIHLTVKLIVNLPADDGRMRRIMGGGFLHDPFHQLLIFRRIVVVMPPAAVTVKHAVLSGIEHLRVSVGKPCRRRGAWRTENDLHARAFRYFQKPVKKIIGKFPFPGFDFAPGKLRHTDHFNPILQHPPQILFPHALRPMLRIIAGAQRDFFQVHTPFHNSSPSAPLGLHILFFQPSNIFTAA